jgi:antitoxin YefM
MQSIYRLHTSELDERFLNAVKLLFTGRVIEIKITDTGSSEQNGAAKGEPEMDETAYLLRSPANRKHLLEAIEHINSGKPLIEVDLDELDKT